MRTMMTVATVALAAFASGALAQPAKSDVRHFDQMARANLAEVEASKLAQDRAQADEVRQFAQRMVEDHGKMLEEQRTMAKAMDMEMPRQPAKEHQAAMKKLKGAQGAEFDRMYMEQMVEDHEKSLKLARDAAKNAKNPQLRAMAEKAAPRIEQHLQMARQIAGAAAGATAAPKKAAPKKTDN